MLHIFNKLKKRQLIESMFSYKGIHRYSNSLRFHPLPRKVMEQQAIFAYETMEHIRNLRQMKNEGISLFKKQIIFDNALRKARELNKQASFDFKNMEKVWEGFDQNLGAIVNFDIWRQHRFKDAAIGRPGENFKRLVLMPSQVTGNIFNQLLISYSPFYHIPIEKERFVISGEKGTGKSFSYLIYSYLAQFILDYRASSYYQNQQGRKNALSYIPLIEFNYIKKIIYLPLNELTKISRIGDHLCLQGYPEIMKDIVEDTEIQTFTEICEKIQKFYNQQNNIKTLYVIDEANYYFSCFRSMLEKNRASKTVSMSKKDKYQQYNESILTNHSVALSIIANFSDILMNTSQLIEGKQISSWNLSKKSKKYFDIYDHQRENFSDLYLEYCSVRNNKQGQLELYDIFYKQLIFQRYRQGIQFVSLTPQKFKTIFYETFKIVSEFNHEENKAQNSEIRQWGLDVRHLNFRAVFQNYKQLQKLKNLLIQRPENSLEHELNIKKELMRLKIQVQKKRFSQIKEKFNTYFNKSVNDDEKNSRFNIICFINQVAFKIIKQGKKDNEQDEDQLNKILNSILTVQQAQKPLNRFNTNYDGRKYSVQVDFKKMIKGKNKNKEIEKENEKTEDIQLLKNKFPSLEKEIDSFIQAVGIGYRTQEDPYKCYFIMDPVLLWQLTLLVDKDFTSFSKIHLEMLLNKIGVSVYVGNNMDIIYYKLFKMNKQFTFRVDKLDFKNQTTTQQFQYKVASCIPFLSRKSVPKMKSLPRAEQKKQRPKLKRDRIKLAMDQIIQRQYEKAETEKQIDYAVQLSYVLRQAKKKGQNNEKQYQWVVGYPETKNRFQDNIMAFRNPLFDFVLVKYFKQDEKDNYVIHTFDLGIGQFLPKSTQIQKLRLVQLAQQLKNRVKSPTNIEFKHFILNLRKNLFSLGKNFFQNNGDNWQNKMNPMTLMYYQQKTVSVQNGIAVQFGIRSANYQEKGKHIDFPPKDYTYLAIVHDLTKKVLDELDEVQEQLKEQLEEKQQ